VLVELSDKDNRPTTAFCTVFAFRLAVATFRNVETVATSYRGSNPFANEADKAITGVGEDVGGVWRVVDKLP